MVKNRDKEMTSGIHMNQCQNYTGLKNNGDLK